MNTIDKRLGAKVIAWPIDEGSEFNGIVDILNRKTYHINRNDHEEYTEIEIPDSYQHMFHVKHYKR